jgi:ABC-type dipeptide/oligopeptide/nickel transport system permease component
MRGAKVTDILLKYFLIFIGLTIFLFTVYKFVPTAVIRNDFPGNSIQELGINRNIALQYFYFLHSLLTGTMGYTYTPFYSGTVYSALSITIPETVLFLGVTFALSYIVSYFIGIYSGTVFKTAKTVNMNIFPLLFLYLVSGLVLLAVFAGVLGWLPSHGILSSSSTALHGWISSTGNSIYITVPTNIIFIDSIIHGSASVFLNFLKHMALPFFSLFIPTTVYMSVFISHEASIEYNKKYMRAGITRNAFMDTYIIYIRRGIRSRVLREMKSVFVIFMGGMVIVSYIFSYMNTGEFAIYSFLNYYYGIMGGIYSFFVLAIMAIIFELFIDIINRGGRNEI